MAEALDARVHLDLDGIAGRATPGIEPAVLAARQWDLMETFPFDVDWDEALARDPKRRGAEGWTEPATPWTGWHGGRA
jgi:hypothetical protein